MSSQMSSVELSIITVTWNSAAYLGPYLTALRQHLADIAYEVFVVDNASSDETVPWLREHGFTPLRPQNMTPGTLPSAQYLLIANKTNLGFAAANNVGLRLARGTFVFFLNPDTEIQPESVQRLLAFLRAHPDVVAVGPKLTRPDGAIQGGAAGHEPSLCTLLHYSLGLYRLSPRLFPGLWLPRKQYTSPRPIEVDWISGAALLTRTSIARRVGGWPEEYFLYGEDMAFCRRLRKYGRIVCLPEAHVVHHIGGSTRQIGHVGIARNIIALDQDYRARFSAPKVALLHLMGALGFGLRWAFALGKGDHIPQGHSVPARELWRVCTLTSLQCAWQALRGEPPPAVSPEFRSHRQFAAKDR